jgi:formate/nitrite transporter FocA (FNT family)
MIGILTASVGFDMGGAPWLAGNGFNRFLSGAVGFPLTIMLVAMTGVGAWTGDIVFVTKAYFDKKTSLASVARFFILSWLGCFAGTIAAAALATGAALPACGPCIDISVHKLAYSFSQVFFRGVGGGCLISLAIFMSKLNRDMVGKVSTVHLYYTSLYTLHTPFIHPLYTSLYTSITPL